MGCELLERRLGARGRARARVTGHPASVAHRADRSNRHPPYASTAHARRTHRTWCLIAFASTLVAASPTNIVIETFRRSRTDRRAVWPPISIMGTYASRAVVKHPRTSGTSERESGVSNAVLIGAYVDSPVAARSLRSPSASSRMSSSTCAPRTPTAATTRGTRSVPPRWRAWAAAPATSV